MPPQAPQPDERARQIEKLKEALEKAGNAAAEAGMAYTVFMQVQDGTMAIDNQGNVTHVVEMDRNGNPSGNILTMQGEKDPWLQNVHDAYNARYRRLILDNPTNVAIIRENPEAMIRMLGNFTEDASKEAAVARENAKIAMARVLKDKKKTPLTAAESAQPQYNFVDRAQQEFTLAGRNPAGQWLRVDKWPGFREPTEAVNAQMQQFRRELAEWRTPIPPGGVAPDVKPEDKFRNFIDAHPDLLTHYVTGEKGEKTHLVKELLQLAIIPDTPLPTPMPGQPVVPPSKPSMNGWALNQLIQHPGVQVQRTIAKVGMDRDLAESESPMSWKMLPYFSENDRAKPVVELIESGMPLHHGPQSVIAMLKQKQKDTFRNQQEIDEPRLSHPFFDAVSRALVKRQGESGEVDYGLLALATERKHYARIAGLIHRGYPLGQAPGSTEIIDTLRRDNDIPQEEAQLLSKVLKERLGDQNPVTAIFLSRLHPEEKKFIDLYRKDLPESLLYLAEEKALAEATHIVDQQPQPMGGKITAGVIVTKRDANGQPLDSKPLLRPLQKFEESYISQVLFYTSHLPLHQGSGFDVADTPEELIRKLTGIMESDAKPEGTAKTPLGKILLDVKARYDALVGPNASPEAKMAARVKIEEELTQEIDVLTQKYKLVDDLGQRGTEVPNHRWREILEAYEPHHIFSGKAKIMGQYESERVPDAQERERKKEAEALAPAQPQQAPPAGGALPVNPEKKAELRLFDPDRLKELLGSTEPGSATDIGSIASIPLPKASKTRNRNAGILG